MKKYKIAAIIMIIHGGIIEIGACLSIITILIFDFNKIDLNNYFSFIIPYLKENLVMVLILGSIYGVVRVIGAIGLLKSKMWGLALSIVNCIVTMVLMLFMLPAGIVDGVLACSALILILTQYFPYTLIDKGSSERR